MRPLGVPLDWNDRSSDSRCVAVAVIKLSATAKVHMSDPRYGGSILTDPGLLLVSIFMSDGPVLMHSSPKAAREGGQMEDNNHI